MSIRSFIALSLNEEIKKAVGELIDGLRKTGADVKWVTPRNLHLTLKFLGSIDESMVSPLSEHLREIAGRHSALSFSLNGTGAFPDQKRPRVIWIGLRMYEPLLEIFREIDEALAGEGFEKESRPFSPHITIGRVRSLKGIDKLMLELVKYKGSSFGEQEVKTIHLMQSTLKPGGAEYSTLFEAPLRRI